MFKNSVFKPNVNTVEWFKAALIRAIKTFAECFAGFLVAGAGVADIDWVHAVSVATVATLLSILVSISGIPEVGGNANE